jgi:hypothetical protein
MTDEELGIVEVEGLGFLPWDGVRGPHLTVVDGKEVVDYPECAHTDYLETVEHFTAALTGKVDQEEYITRVLAMAQVYWALGIRWKDFGEQYGIAEALDRFQAAKAEWTVLSFRALGEGSDGELTEAETAAGIRFQGDTRYRFHLFQWNGVETPRSARTRIGGRTCATSGTGRPYHRPMSLSPTPETGRRKGSRSSAVAAVPVRKRSAPWWRRSGRLTNVIVASGN